MKRRLLIQAYLLRCWQANDTNSDTPIWRYSLEGVRDKQRHGFATLEALLTYLKQIAEAEHNSDNTSVSS